MPLVNRIMSNQALLASLGLAQVTPEIEGDEAEKEGALVKSLEDTKPGQAERPLGRDGLRRSISSSNSDSDSSSSSDSSNNNSSSNSSSNNSSSSKSDSSNNSFSLTRSWSLDSPSPANGSTGNCFLDDDSDCESECASDKNDESACDSSLSSAGGASDSDDDDFYAGSPEKRGLAEKLRQESRRTGRFCELRHAADDEAASDGFWLRGFHGGVRVYGLASRFAERLQQTVVRTAVGRACIDLAAACPPRVVVVAQLADLLPSAPAATSGPVPGTTVAAPGPVAGAVRHVNGMFAIRPSALGGLGSFALRDLARGDHILVERPLLRTTLFHLTHELARLPAEKRAAYFLLHGHHPDPRASEAERIWTANTFAAGVRHEAVFELASRFNHACAPRHNVDYRFDVRHRLLTLTVVRPVQAGDELFISYGKTPQMLFERFGFRCSCGACDGFAEERATQHYAQIWI